MDGIFGRWVYDAAGGIGMVLCAWRAIKVREDRTTWSLIALAFVLEVAGDEIYVALSTASTPPVPSIADMFWLAFYVPMAAALMKRGRALGTARGLVALDILIAVGALASITAAFVVPAILAGGGRASTLGLATSVAYPVGDLVLVALVLRIGAATGWRLGRAATLMAVCFLCWVVADTVYAFQIAHQTYIQGGLLDLGWVGPFVLFGIAAWLPPDAPPTRQAPGWASLAVPAVFAVVALSMVLYAATAGATVLSLSLAAGALMGVIARFVLTFRSYLIVLGETEREAVTDSLTGLGNRRALSSDLATFVAARQEGQFLLFDLNGFKGYNDTFGHPAGDALLERLGKSLRQAAGNVGTAYRMGGDEFCVLLGAAADERTVSAAEAALCEHGEGFGISASHGRVALPAEAGDAEEALRTADQRMYRSKRSGRGNAGEQATSALMRVLCERHGNLRDHSEGVADLAEAVARELGEDDASIREVRSAAELHDIGKAAIPDAILHKPGPLDDEEWAFMRRHTLIGERIVASASALAGVARLVRSSHERWDGAGYPDGLAGEHIPRGARIIAVCDAFDAMLTRRPYSAPLEVDAAVAELGRCAGGQFDPLVVAAFTTVIRERAASPLAVAAAAPEPTVEAHLEPGVNRDRPRSR